MALLLTAIVSIFSASMPSAAAPRTPPLDGATAWLNSSPLSPADLRGKVVLVEFWTYTCINWRRTLPYVRAWSERYKDAGLVVIGVHTPEFGFEADLANVRAATSQIGIEFPVAVDSKFAIWRAFDNEYWPAMYFIDATGRIRHSQFGEGKYDDAERTIQKLLAEAGHAVADDSLTEVAARGAEAQADWRTLGSPETYLGYQQTVRFASSGGRTDKPSDYALPTRLKLNEWALAGNWTQRKDSVLLNRANGRVAYRFHARDVHLIMGQGAAREPIRFRVLIDGQPPGASHGIDVDADGYGELREPRMYQLVRQQGPIADRQVEIEFLEAGAELFDFTFG
ncbi:MAG TPA: thioredoxin family protein [Steroidobacter sp.]